MAKLAQVGPSWVKLILVGLLCPPVGQEFAESAPVVLVSRDTEHHVLHPFTRGLHTHCFATAHQRVYDGGTNSGVVIPAEQEVLSPKPVA